MLNPSRLRKDLGELLLGSGARASGSVEKNGATTRGALIQRQNEAHNPDPVTAMLSGNKAILRQNASAVEPQQTTSEPHKPIQ
jgi:hypothetical protein